MTIMKEDRASAAHRNEEKSHKYSVKKAEEENFFSFTAQLNKLGLELREIPGDGNCLFRALGDQIDGHSRFHLHYREIVVEYISNHREEFEPFIEDNVPFEEHVKSLSRATTYAGNDAIVAFARLHNLTVVIHQLESPMLEVHGCSGKSGSKQIHISYHNGNHYSSVRRIADTSEKPNNVFLTTNSPSVESASQVEKPEEFSIPENLTDMMCEQYDEEELFGLDATYVISNISLLTGCKDRMLIGELWTENSFDFDETILKLKIITGLSRSSDSDSEQKLKTAEDGKGVLSTDKPANAESQESVSVKPTLTHEAGEENGVQPQSTLKRVDIMCSSL